MNTTIGSAVVTKVINLLTGPNGVNARLAGTSHKASTTAVLNAGQVRAQNVSAEIAERSNAMQYPSANVYCERIVNDLVEKFRSVSGSAEVTVEVRHSLDRLDGLQDGLENYADAVTQVLTANRGDWGDGLFYDGSFQASFGGVKSGGRNFIQVAKITFKIGVSRN